MAGSAKRKDRAQAIAILKRAAIAVLCVAAIIGVLNIRGHGRAVDKIPTLQGLLALPLSKFSISADDLVRESSEERLSGSVKYRFAFQQYKFSKNIPLKDFEGALSKRLTGTDFRIVKSDYYHTAQEETASFDIGYKKMTVFSLRLDKAKTTKPQYAKRKFTNPRIAIVLDDFGYNENTLDALFAMNIPVTFSILPNLPYSSRIADAAHSRGFEVILHLPLEPLENERLEEGTIMTSMSSGEVIGALQADLTSVPHLKGISNHMGSKAMQDEALLKIIFEFMKLHDLFFLDSVVINNYIAEGMARDAALRYAKRSVFLDNQPDIGYIKGQLDQLRDIAFKKGSAIGVGHARALTVKVLSEVLPQYKAEGVRFVRVSELAK